jgi:DNA-binding transcriptional ArsR family regulator
VIEWRLTPEDVARVRFAFSPLFELVLSLIVLRAPGRHSLHLPWVRSVRPRVGAVDLSELIALVPVRGIVADFLSPPPTTPLPELTTEFDLLRHTPPEQVIADLVDVPDVPDAVRDRINRDPGGAVDRLADTLQSYWDIAFAEHWPRIRALLEADILWRSHQLATGGAHALFDDLHESLTWNGDSLTATDPWSHSGSLAGEGLVLVPSAMTWPTVRKMVQPYQPLVAYPARAIATLWETGDRPSPAALTALIGRTRAHILTTVAEPTSTTALARHLSLTPGAVSQHLSVLRANGLVTGTRVGGSVLYHRTTRGDALIADQKPRRA